MNHIEPRRNPQVVGMILIALGILFLLGQILDLGFIRLNWGEVPWPLFPIVPGIVIIVLGLVLAKFPTLTILGVISTVTGLILWFQDSTGMYQTWAYAWALVIPTSIGLGLTLHGVVTHQPSLLSRGVRFVVIGLVLFGIGLAFFEFTLNLSGFGDSVVGRSVAPLLVIALGMYVFLRRISRPVDEADTTDKAKRRAIAYLQPSEAWPVLLIALGAIWLLRVFDILSNANLAVLFRLWPLFLIIIGADILLRRDSRQLAQYIVFGGLALILVLMIGGPALGLWQVTAKTFDKVEAIQNATSATITLNLGAGTNQVDSIDDSQTLFKSNATYLGNLNYSVSGSETKTINLTDQGNNDNFWDSFSADLHTNIGLSSAIPMSLSVDTGSGSSTFNLTGLKVTNLNINGGSGLITANLPALQDKYSATFSGGSGMQTINIPSNTTVSLNASEGSAAVRIAVGTDTTLTLKFEGGSGMTIIDVPDGSAVHVETSGGSGVVFVKGVPCATGRECNRNGGVWESVGYSDAPHQIYINANLGSGGLTVW